MDSLIRALSSVVENAGFEVISVDPSLDDEILNIQVGDGYNAIEGLAIAVAIDKSGLLGDREYKIWCMSDVILFNTMDNNCDVPSEDDFVEELY